MCVTSWRETEERPAVTENAIAKEIVDAAFHIHTALGPGLLESVYDAVLAYELGQRGLRTVRQQPIQRARRRFSRQAAKVLASARLLRVVPLAWPKRKPDLHRTGQTGSHRKLDRATSPSLCQLSFVDIEYLLR